MVFYDKLRLKLDENPYSKNIEKVLRKNNNSIIIGLTKITLDEDILKIVHSGRDKHTMDNINWNLLDSGLQSVSLLKNVFPILRESGNPNYYYVIQFQL